MMLSLFLNCCFASSQFELAEQVVTACREQRDLSTLFAQMQKPDHIAGIALTKAAFEKDEAVLTRLADCDPDEEGKTGAFLTASAEGFEEGLRLLIHRFGYVQFDFDRALWNAAERSHLCLFPLLFESVSNEGLMKVVERCVKNNTPPVMSCLLDQVDHRSDFDYAGRMKTALWEAATSNCLEIVEMFLQLHRVQRFEMQETIEELKRQRFDGPLFVQIISLSKEMLDILSRV